MPILRKVNTPHGPKIERVEITPRHNDKWPDWSAVAWYVYINTYGRLFFHSQPLTAEDADQKRMRHIKTYHGVRLRTARARAAKEPIFTFTGY